MKKLICIEEQTFMQLVSQIERLARMAERLRQKLKQPVAEEWIGAERVCQRLDITKRTLQSYRERGILPFSTIEGKTLFRQKDIEAFLQSRTVKFE